MAELKATFSLVNAIFGGIIIWIIATLLDSTAIFSAIANLPAIGLFVGFMFGGFYGERLAMKLV